MRATRTAATTDDYVVTEKGSHDLRVVETCVCNPRLVGLLIECPDCGTVYGSVKESVGWGMHARDKR